MTTETADTSTWWGSHEIPLGSCGEWTVGPLTLWIERAEGEWRVAHTTHQEHLDPTIRVKVPVEGVELLSLDKVTRFAVTGESCEVHLTPALADRPLISRPEKPFVVLPGEDIAVFLSSPLWIQVAVGPERRLLTEVPTYRPSDTWFGPDTTQGELCYASRTTMRLHLDQVPLRANRAVTTVQVRNRGQAGLTVDRLNLPVVYLSLFRATADELWTESVVFERPEGSEVFQLRLRETAGVRASDVTGLVASPRLPMPDRLSVRALASLFN